MSETIILMRTNLMEVSRKTGVRYTVLEAKYLEAKARNEMVTVKVSDTGLVTYD